jgi:hypothetical protein
MRTGSRRHGMSDFLIGLITVLVYFAVVCTWFFALFDLFFRNLRGWEKAAWLLAIVFVPIFGVIAYFATRPQKSIEELWAQPSQDGLYAQRDDTVALRIQTLSQLRKEGAITSEEFDRLKEKTISTV